MSIKINNKEYEVPQLGFKDMVAMEDMGFSIIDLFQKQKVFSVATAFVGICAGCSRDEAERLIEQHIIHWIAFMKVLLWRWIEAVFSGSFWGENRRNNKLY